MLLPSVMGVSFLEFSTFLEGGREGLVNSVYLHDFQPYCIMNGRSGTALPHSENLKRICMSHVT